MQLTKEDKLSIIKTMMQHNDVLSPLFFDTDKIMLPHIRKKMLDMVSIIKNHYISFFPNIEIEDIILTGSLCSYIYTSTSDIDLFILFKNISDNNVFNFFTKIGTYINRNIKPKIYNHAIDFGITYSEKYYNMDEHKLDGYNTYSILNNRWHIEPIKQEFDFSIQELYNEYCKYSAQIHQYVKELPKINDAYLTYESAISLSQKIMQSKIQAFIAKDQDKKHEYSLTYNIYRLSKKFCLFQHFMRYAEESFKYDLSRKKI